MPSPNADNTGSTAVRLNWTPIAAHPDPKHGLPLARSSHGVSYLSGSDTLVVYGGEHVARTPLPADQACWACVHVTSAAPTWKCLSAASTAAAASPPPRIAHAQAVVQDRYVYMFGGRAGITMQEQAMNDLWQLDTVDWSWTQVETTMDARPPARSFHRMVAVDDRFLFVFGGCGAEGRLNDLWKFDCTTNEWHSLGASPLLKGRGGPNLLCLGPSKSCERIAVIAGFAGEETNDGHAYHLAQQRWEPAVLSGLSELRPRSVCAAATLRDYAVLFGGEVDPSARGHEGAGGFANDVVLLDRRTGALLQTITEANHNSSKE